jgi:hypothetical protein
MLPDKHKILASILLSRLTPYIGEINGDNRVDIDLVDQLFIM